jgi:hypothetical protein
MVVDNGRFIARTPSFIGSLTANLCACHEVFALVTPYIQLGVFLNKPDASQDYTFVDTFLQQSSFCVPIAFSVQNASGRSRLSSSSWCACLSLYNRISPIIEHDPQLMAIFSGTLMINHLVRMSERSRFFPYL